MSRTFRLTRSGFMLATVVLGVSTFEGMMTEGRVNGSVIAFWATSTITLAMVAIERRELSRV